MFSNLWQMFLVGKRKSFHLKLYLRYSRSFSIFGEIQTPKFITYGELTFYNVNKVIIKSLLFLVEVFSQLTDPYKF